MTEITTGLSMSAAERNRVLLSMEARALLAERHGLPKTAESWREAARNIEGSLSDSGTRA